MSEEEKEAVKILEDEDNIIVKIGYNDYGVEHIRKIYDDGEKERILNLIDKLQKVIENIIQYCLLHKSFSTLVCRDTSAKKCNTYRENGGCNKCVRDYFLEKAEEEKWKTK